VFQSLPVDGIVTVSAPQELVAMIVGKAVNLAHDMDVEVLGLVENMAYFKCDDCGKEHHIFGEPQGAEVAERYNIPAYTTLPIDPKFARLCDEGKVEDYDVEGKLDVIIDKIVSANKPNYGFDAQNEVYVDDMIAAGIVDPTKVTRSALENAASVAEMVLTTESLVADLPEPPAPAAPAGDMGGMGGMY